MTNITYIVHGRKVGRSRALRAWQVSTTYKRANHANEIFSKAERGIDDGGVANHLREAGVRVIVSKDEANK